MIDYSIEQLIKHRRGMLLIDRILSYDELGIVVEVVIQLNSSFLQTDHVPAWVGIEYAAQAVAALAGLTAIQGDKETQIGLLLSCRKYKSSRPCFMLGEVLRVHVIEEFNNGQMGVYSCCIYDKEDNKIVTVSLNAFMPANIDEIKGMVV